MINLESKYLDIVMSIIRRHVPNCEVRCFGSRYLGTNKKYSDLDIVIVGQHRIEISTMSDLKYDFEESDLPFRVDILDWYDMSPGFKKIIENGYEILLG